MQTIIDNISKQFNTSDVHQQRKDLVFLTVDQTDVIPLLAHLKEVEKFTHFVNMTATDWIEDNLFQLTYILHNHDLHVDLGIRTFIDREKAEMISAHHLWEQVATYQREFKEMYGIDFPGSPRVDESFLLEGWDNIPPMRREFDTKKYAEETYFPREGRTTKDPSEHMKENLYPNDPSNK